MYFQMDNYFYETCETKKMVTKAESEVADFKKSSGVTTASYCEELLEKPLRCCSVFDESTLKGVVTMGLYPFICYAMLFYQRAHKDFPLHVLARH